MASIDDLVKEIQENAVKTEAVVAFTAQLSGSNAELARQLQEVREQLLAAQQDPVKIDAAIAALNAQEALLDQVLAVSPAPPANPPV